MPTQELGVGMVLRKALQTFLPKNVPPFQDTKAMIIFFLWGSWFLSSMSCSTTVSVNDLEEGSIIYVKTFCMPTLVNIFLVSETYIISHFNIFEVQLWLTINLNIICWLFFLDTQLLNWSCFWELMLENWIISYSV